MKSIGILGGTFDPIHLGHTEPAKQVASYLSLDKVLVIPASIPPHKATPNVSATQRADMVKLACAGEKNFICDTRELSRSGHSYTVDTLAELKQSYPEDKLFFIVGLDSLLTFTTWRKYQKILSLCHLVVNTRPNYQLGNMNQATQALLNQHKITCLDELKRKTARGIIIVPDIIELLSAQSEATEEKSIAKSPINIDISSSEIREALASNQPCQQFLNPNVLAFINKNQLYR